MYINNHKLNFINRLTELILMIYLLIYTSENIMIKKLTLWSLIANCTKNADSL